MAQLAPLHVSALRLEPETVLTLERLGLKTIGALSACPASRLPGGSAARKMSSMRSIVRSGASMSR